MAIPRPLVNSIRSFATRTIPTRKFNLRKSSKMVAAASVSHPSELTVPNKTAHAFDKSTLDALLARRFFFAPSFEIYGGVAGLYDYGPTGSALQANILDAWRKHYIIEEDMLELDTTIMTLSDVLKTSGHVDKFADWMVKDVKNGEIYRADHLVEGVLEARLKGDKEARGVKEEEKKEEEDDKKKKKKKIVKTEAVKLDDNTVAEYEYLLAQASQLHVNYTRMLTSSRLITTLVPSSVILSESTKSPTPPPETRSLSLSSSISCSSPTSVLLATLKVTSVPKPPRVTLSTLLVSSSSTTARSPSPLLRSVKVSETKSPPDRACSVSGKFIF